MNKKSNRAFSDVNAGTTGRLSCILDLFKYQNKLKKQTCVKPWTVAMIYSWDKFLFPPDVIGIQLAYRHAVG